MKVKIIVVDNYNGKTNIDTIYESEDNYFILELFRMIIFDIKLKKKLKK